MFREDASIADRRFLIVAVGGSIAALDRRTGERCWDRSVHSKGPLTVAVHVGRIVVACPGRAIVCLEYETGRELWRELTSHDVGPATLLCEGDSIFVARGGVVDSFGLDGEVRWFEPLAGHTSDVAMLALPGVAAQAPPSRPKSKRSTR